MGPLAGYFGRQARVPLEIVPVSPAVDGRLLSFVFDISMAVRRDDEALGEQLDAVIRAHEREIRRVLARYHVPLVDRKPDPAGPRRAAGVQQLR